LTPEELQKVEDLVNDAIRRDLKVTREFMKLDQAVEKGALAFFRDTYGDEVSVYTVGDFSKEVCGGPHVEHTGVLKHFRITKQDNIGAGLMRIRAVLDEE
jgi:alanyl-tRNA synthetase